MPSGFLITVCVDYDIGKIIFLRFGLALIKSDLVRSPKYEASGAAEGILLIARA